MGLTGIPFLDTIISVISLLVFITIVGLSASSFVFKRLFDYLEGKLEQAPIIRHIYSPIKDFMNAFMGNKKRFTKPVLVLTNPQANIEEMGFITQDDLKEWGIKEKYAVYLPYSYSFSGRMIIVPKEQITPLPIDGGEAMKFIISSAFSSGILLFGISLLYGVTGSLNFDEIAQALHNQPLHIIVLVFLMAGFAFKLSVVPFHLWTADVYEGGPMPTTAFLSVVSKGAMSFVFITALYKVFHNMNEVWYNMLMILAVLTL